MSQTCPDRPPPQPQKETKKTLEIDKALGKFGFVGADDYLSSLFKSQPFGINYQIIIVGVADIFIEIFADKVFLAKMEPADFFSGLERCIRFILNRIIKPCLEGRNDPDAKTLLHRDHKISAPA